MREGRIYYGKFRFLDDNVGSVVKLGELGKGKVGVRLGWSWWGGGF